jgi:hypothetical protein
MWKAFMRGVKHVLSLNVYEQYPPFESRVQVHTEAIQQAEQLDQKAELLDQKERRLDMLEAQIAVIQRDASREER